MATGSAIVGAVGAVGGLLEGNKQSSLAEKQLKQSAAATAQATEFQKQRVALAKWNLDRYKDKFVPLEDAYLEEASSGKPTSYYGEEKGALEGNFNRAEDQIAGNTSLGSGLQSSMLNGVGIEKAKSLSELKIKDDQRKDQMKVNMMNLGRSNVAAANGVDTALGGAGNFFGEVSNSLMKASNNSSSLANDAYGTAAQGMYQLAESLGKTKKDTTV